MKKSIKGAIFDLDGVITRTADQHSRAWKDAFDAYNERRRRSNREPFESFSIEKDYPKYIDGLPRYRGVEKFLESRDIDLPYGSPDDDPAKETICGIGNLKNDMFRKLIREEGVDMLEKNIDQIRKWRKNGLKTAVISSSKNCKHILESVGLSHLFHVRIDGVETQERGIEGKPAPDVFLEAAKDLQLDPGFVMVFEDSTAGIKAASKGNFNQVIGVINALNREQLLEAGADRVVKHFGKLRDLELDTERWPEDLPLALDEMDRIREKFRNQDPLMFLDFDGTLAPIVENHEDASISEEMRELVKQVSDRFPTAVVSGRGMQDVKERVGLRKLYYAGSHGFEISGPDGYFKENEEAQEVLPLFEELEPLLREKLGDIDGVEFERKKFTLAIHFRKVKQDQEAEVHDLISEALKDYNKLSKTAGKKVIEIRPAIDWHKGRAVETLRTELGSEDQEFAVYLGDDVTDEDAFEYIQPGIGILVGEHGHTTLADYYLKDLDEVKQFFRKLLDD